MYRYRNKLYLRSKEDLGYSYMVERAPKYCLFVQSTGLLFYFQVDHFLRSIYVLSTFEAVRVALYKILTSQIWNVLQSWKFVFIGSFRATHFLLQKLQTDEASILVHKKFARSWVERWMFGLVRHPTFFREMWRINTLQKEPENAKFQAT